MPLQSIVVSVAKITMITDLRMEDTPTTDAPQEGTDEGSSSDSGESSE